MADSLLQQIQDEAVDSNYDLGNLLRKCRVLAQRLGNEDLKEWVRCELNGYLGDMEEDLPEYRIIGPVIVQGHYMGLARAQLTNFPIPQTAIKDDQIRKKVFTIYATGSVPELEHMVKEAGDEGLRFTLPPEVRSFIKDPGVRQDMQLAAIWRTIDTSGFQGISNTVRNKILDFTLELESEVERTGAPIQNINSQEPDKVQHIFNTQIHGSVGNVAQGNRDVSQSATVNTGDLSSLKEALQELGLPKELEAEILTAAEEQQPEDGKLPARLAELIGKVAVLGAQGALAISGSVAVKVLTRSLCQFFGISF